MYMRVRIRSYICMYVCVYIYMCAGGTEKRPDSQGDDEIARQNTRIDTQCICVRAGGTEKRPDSHGDDENARQNTHIERPPERTNDGIPPVGAYHDVYRDVSQLCVHICMYVCMYVCT